MQATATDARTTNVVVVRKDTSFTDVAATLRDFRVNAFPVLDGYGPVVGALSEVNLLATEALDCMAPSRIASMLHRGEPARADSGTAASLMSKPTLIIGPCAPTLSWCTAGSATRSAHAKSGPLS